MGIGSGLHTYLSPSCHKTITANRINVLGMHIDRIQHQPSCHIPLRLELLQDHPDTELIPPSDSPGQRRISFSHNNSHQPKHKQRLDKGVTDEVGVVPPVSSAMSLVVEGGFRGRGGVCVPKWTAFPIAHHCSILPPSPYVAPTPWLVVVGFTFRDSWSVRFGGCCPLTKDGGGRAGGGGGLWRLLSITL